MTKKDFFSLANKFLLAAIGISGVLMNIFSDSFMGNFSGMLYFTMQSNITIVIMALIFAISNILEISGKKGFITEWLQVLKFLFTVAITITFLVFFVLLAPTTPASYLLSFGNLSVHFIVPVLALVDLFVFDKKINLSHMRPLFGLAMPFYYLIFAFTVSELGGTFNGDKFPYFFLDYHVLGWFSFENGIGAGFWIIILTVFVIGLSYLIATIKKRVDRKR